MKGEPAMFSTFVGAIRIGLVAAMVVSVSAAFIGNGTQAAFIAQTTNPNNVFQAGVLQIHHSKNGQVLFKTQAVQGQNTQVTGAGIDNATITGAPLKGGLVPGSKL